MKSRSVALLLLSASLSVSLAACQPAAHHASQQGSGDRINAVLDRAATNASQQGNTKESLALLERMYERDSTNPETAAKYAGALRDAGRLNRASTVLAPFAEGGKSDHPAIVLEYAAISAAMGDYAVAETYASKAVTMMPDNGKAYHILGVALDAQGKNQPAEQAFRTALDHWEGDPVPVLNNLGLNLASQGFIDEALETLRKAAALAPDRKEIERNLRIVSALQVQPPKTGTRLVPMPPRKKPDRPV